MKKIIVLLFVLFSFVGYAQSVTSVTKYRTGKLYPINELVSKDGVIYRALSSTTSSPPSADWVSALSSGGAETDPIFIAWDKSSGISITESQISDLTHSTDTDTQLNQAGVEALGFVIGAHTTDTNTQLNQTQVGTFATAEGFIKTFSELDPVYSAWNKSTGISITESQISDLTHTTDTDDQTGAEVVLTGYVKPGTSSSVSATDNTNQAIGKLEKSIDDATSGGVTSVAGKTGVVTLVENDISDLTHTTDTNTQLDLSGVQALGFVTGAHTTDTNTQLSQANVGTFATAEGFIKTFSELDPAYTSSQSSNITAQNITDLGNLSGANTGDQNISGISTNSTNIATNVTAIGLNTAKTSFPGFSTLLSDYSFTDNSTNWNTAFGWGDHASGGYSTGAHTTDTNTQLSEATVDGYADDNGYQKEDALTRVTNSNTAITISTSDYGTIIYCTGTSAVTVTIPDTLTAIDGQTFSIVQWSAFQVSIVGSGTTTIKSTSATEKTLEEASAIQFIHIGTDSDDWHAIGSLEDN